MISLLSE